jgi:hypothetical protein
MLHHAAWHACVMPHDTAKRLTRVGKHCKDLVRAAVDLGAGPIGWGCFSRVGEEKLAADEGAAMDMHTCCMLSRQLPGAAHLGAQHQVGQVGAAGVGAHYKLLIFGAPVLDGRRLCGSVDGSVVSLGPGLVHRRIVGQLVAIWSA